MDTNRLHISFYINKQRAVQGQCTIYMRITVAGVREAVNTGVYVQQQNWDKAKSRIKGTSPDVLAQNNLLSALRTKATNIYAESINQGLPITSQVIKAKLVNPGTKAEYLMRLFELHNEYVKRKVGIEVSKATHAKYETLRLKVKGYLRKSLGTGDIPLDKLNKGFLMGFELYLKADEHIGHNTAIKYIQFLKRVINYGIGMEWLKHDPFKAFKCTLQPVIRECLTQEEVDRIHIKELVSPRLGQVRDVFVFSCYTGLAYADVKKLRHGEITKGVDGQLWIQTYRAKTNTRVPIPLLPEALKLIDKYKPSSDDSSRLVFPVLSNQKMNSYLKEIADVCGITKTLTFHIARHTFATTITLSNGVPIETVSKLLGHTNIKTTQIYSKVIDAKISADMSMLRTKLQSKKGNKSDRSKS
jgi:site-specific recombinase XerD